MGNVETYGILILSIKETLIQTTYALFSKVTSTHKRYKCAGGAENIQDELTSNVLGMLRK